MLLQICQVAHGHLCRRVTGEEKKQLSSGGGDAGGSTIRNTRPDPGGGVGRGRVAVWGEKITRWPRRGPPENDFASSEHAT